MSLATNTPRVTLLGAQLEIDALIQRLSECPFDQQKHFDQTLDRIQELRAYVRNFRDSL